MKSCTLFAAAVLARFVSADHDLVFPIVALGDAGADDDEFKDFHAQVMDVNEDVTTYSVGCATEPCAGWANLPPFTYTIAIGPSSKYLPPSPNLFCPYARVEERARLPQYKVIQNMSTRGCLRSLCCSKISNTTSEHLGHAYLKIFKVELHVEDYQAYTTCSIRL